jgi:hypothetical protein
MPFSLRLDPETERLLRKLAKSSTRSKSAVVREAVAAYDAANEVPGARSALDRVRPFVGIIDTSAQNSTDTHAKYRQAVQQKHRARGAR